MPAVPRAFPLLLVAGLLPLAGVAVLRSHGDVPLADMLRDVTALAEIHPLYSGLPSARLALDDQFQVHEGLAPDYLGVAEPVSLALLSAATVAYLWRFRRTILRSPGRSLLLVSLGFLAGSLLVDTILIGSMWLLRDWKLLVEDGLKWLGIVFWLGFCAVHCRAALLESMRRNPAR